MKLEEVTSVVELEKALMLAIPKQLCLKGGGKLAPLPNEKFPDFVERALNASRLEGKGATLLAIFEARYRSVTILLRFATNVATHAGTLIEDEAKQRLFNTHCIDLLKNELKGEYFSRE